MYIIRQLKTSLVKKVLKLDLLLLMQNFPVRTDLLQQRMLSDPIFMKNSILIKVNDKLILVIGLLLIYNKLKVHIKPQLCSIFSKYYFGLNLNIHVTLKQIFTEFQYVR